MKLFQSNNIEIVTACREFFGFELPSALLPKRVEKFQNRFYNKSVLIVLSVAGVLYYVNI